MICSPYIPFRIEEGTRNIRMFSLLSQYALLNPFAGGGFLKSIADSINGKMYPNLSGKEISLVIDSVLKKREAGSLELYLNEERRVLFNPTVSFTTKEKMQIVNRELGKRKSDFTKEIIYLVLENWNFEADGKIIQEKVAEYANQGVSTVKSHWADFKAYVKDLNCSYYKPTVKYSRKATKAEVLPDMKGTFRLEDQVNLYELLPTLSFSVEESMSIIDGLNQSSVSMRELVTYIGYQRKQQKYNDYKGVAITPERVNLLKGMIAA